MITNSLFVYSFPDLKLICDYNNNKYTLFLLYPISDNKFLVITYSYLQLIFQLENNELKIVHQFKEDHYPYGTYRISNNRLIKAYVDKFTVYDIANLNEPIITKEYIIQNVFEIEKKNIILTFKNEIFNELIMIMDSTSFQEISKIQIELKHYCFNVLYVGLLTEELLFFSMENEYFILNINSCQVEKRFRKLFKPIGIIEYNTLLIYGNLANTMYTLNPFTGEDHKFKDYTKIELCQLIGNNTFIMNTSNEIKILMINTKYM